MTFYYFIIKVLSFFLFEADAFDFIILSDKHLSRIVVTEDKEPEESRDTCHLHLKYWASFERSLKK